jgi:hypothetical protein
MLSANEWIPAVLILSDAAVIGFSEIILTFSIILSSGSSTSLRESSVKKYEATDKTMQMKVLRAMLMIDYDFEVLLVE